MAKAKSKSITEPHADSGRAFMQVSIGLIGDKGRPVVRYDFGRVMADKNRPLALVGKLMNMILDLGLDRYENEGQQEEDLARLKEFIASFEVKEVKTNG